MIHLCWYLPQFGPYEASACVNSSQFGTRPAGPRPWLAPRYCSVQWTYLFALHQHCSTQTQKLLEIKSWATSGLQAQNHNTVLNKYKCQSRPCSNVCFEATCSVRQWDGSQTAAAVSALRRWCRSCLSPRPGCRSPASRGSGSAWSPSSASPLRGNGQADKRS